jgi:3-methyladenine DNA glycosylase AlkD
MSPAAPATALRTPGAPRTPAAAGTSTAAGTAPATTTERARALVAARTPASLELGSTVAELATDPAAAARVLMDGLRDLADPEYLAGQQRIAPGIGPVLGVRQPLLTAVSRTLIRGTRRDSTVTRLDLAERLLREAPLELHWVAYHLIERAVGTDPERAWQLVRAEARTAADWITVDSLAHVAGRGILAEPYRWAELEQLVYSPSRWERRLVGSTIATLPHVDRTAGRRPDVATRGLGILAEIIGDAAPEVQKALSWALRAMARVDPDATVAFLWREARRARDGDDGHRAWVVRDALENLPGGVADPLRATVDGIRRRPGAPSTSRAALAAASFIDLGLNVPPAERHVVDRT